MSFLFVHFCPETVPTGLPKASQVAPLPPVVDVEAWEMWSVSSFFKVIKLQTQWVDWVDVDKVDPWFSIGPIGPYWFHIVTLFHTWLVIDRKKCSCRNSGAQWAKGARAALWSSDGSTCGRKIVVVCCDRMGHVTDNWNLSESIRIYRNLASYGPTNTAISAVKVCRVL
jgi:hypothetical protein